MPGLAKNVGRMTAYRFLSEFLLIAPVLIPYYLAAGLNATQVFTVQAVYAAGVLLLEVPSGYLADVVGRRRTLLLGALLVPLGLSVYFLWRRFPGFLVAEGLLAVGSSMRSGCDSALIYDTLLALKQESEYKRIEGRLFFTTRLGTAASSILGGLAATLFLSLPFALNIATAALSVPLACSLAEPPRQRRPEGKRPLAEILAVARRSLLDRRLRPLMFLWALMSAGGITGIWSYFIYYEKAGIQLGLFGVLFALFQLASALGARLAGGVARRLGSQRALWPLLVPGGLWLGLGFRTGPEMAALIPLAALAWGYAVPELADGINRRIDSAHRATVLSVAAMGGSLGFVALAPLFGFLTDRLSLAAAYRWLGGALLLATLAALAAERRHRSREL